jgi:hypothetical protein
VRDSKDRASAVLTFGPEAWRRFAAAIKVFENERVRVPAFRPPAQPDVRML